MAVQLEFHLGEFEGPLELLLFLISKHKLNINDIEISALLEQYLDYIERMQAADLEVASDFLEMAARLVYIKTVSLLPRQEEEGEQLRRGQPGPRQGKNHSHHKARGSSWNTASASRSPGKWRKCIWGTGYSFGLRRRSGWIPFIGGIIGRKSCWQAIGWWWEKRRESCPLRRRHFPASSTGGWSR